MWLWQPSPNDAKCYSTSMYWLRMLKNVTTWMSLLISDLLTSRTVKHIIYQKKMEKSIIQKSIQNLYEIHRKLIKFRSLRRRETRWNTSPCARRAFRKSLAPPRWRHRPVATSMGTFTRNHHGQMINRLIQSGAPKIAKLVYNSNNYGLWYL